MFFFQISRNLELIFMQNNRREIKPAEDPAEEDGAEVKEEEEMEEEAGDEAAGEEEQEEEVTGEDDTAEEKPSKFKRGDNDNEEEEDEEEAGDGPGLDTNCKASFFILFTAMSSFHMESSSLNCHYVWPLMRKRKWLLKQPFR